MNQQLLIFSALILLTFCAHQSDVVPMEDGQYMIQLSTLYKEEGGPLANRQALNYCRNMGFGSQQVHNLQTDYVGKMDEGRYRRIKKASKALQQSGGSMDVTGDGMGRMATDAASGKGGTLHGAAGEGYKTQLIFSCER
jgi:hypothetical protein